MDIPADACHSPSSRSYMSRYDFARPPPMSEEMEMFFIIQSQHEAIRRKDSEIQSLIRRVKALEQLLLEQGVRVIPVERWRE